MDNTGYFLRHSNWSRWSYTSCTLPKHYHTTKTSKWVTENQYTTLQSLQNSSCLKSAWRKFMLCPIQLDTQSFSNTYINCFTPGVAIGNHNVTSQYLHHNVPKILYFNLLSGMQSVTFHCPCWGGCCIVLYRE